MSKLEVDTIAPQSGTQVTLGESGDTVTIPTGVTLDASNATTTLPSNIVTTDGTQTLTNKSIAATQLTGTITPSDGTVTNAKVNASAAIDYSKLNLTGNIALADLSATGTKDATTFLRGDNTFATAGGDNTPSFFAVSTATEDNVNVADNTLTKMTFSTEVYDTDSCYDNSTNYRFTPTEAGKYFVFTKAMSDNVIANATTKLEFYKNGSQMDDQYRMRFKTGGTVGDIEHTLILSAIIDMNGSTDYIEVYAAHDNGGNTGGLYDKHFGAFKLIGV